MKINIVLAVLILFCAGMAKAQSNLNVTISNVKNADGNMAVALYNTEGTFMEDDQEYKGKIVEIKQADQMTVTIEDLPEGTYAVSVFHDENGNSELDKNMLGIPKEPYGFSNDASGTMGPPSFEDASFKVAGEDTNINITLK